MATPKKPAAKAAETTAPAETGAPQIVSPAAGTMQTGQDDTGGATSGAPTVSDIASPPPPVTDPVATAIAGQIDGEPDPDLVAAVRQYLASNAFAPVEADTSWRLGFPVLMHLDLDREAFEPGELAFVTEGEFDTLQKAKVFAPNLDWEDGALPEEASDGEG